MTDAAIDLSGPTDRALTTTRSVRRHLDLERPVDPHTVAECLRVATCAPNGGNLQAWRFIVVTDPDVRAGLAAVYRRAFAVYRDGVLAGIRPGRPDETARQRTLASAEHLAAVLDRVPVHVVPCQILTPVHPDDAPAHYRDASAAASVYPAVWSLQVALRTRGLASVLTTLHLRHEDEAAAILGIPRRVRQYGLVAVAHRSGPEAGPPPRRPLADVVFLDRWGARWEAAC